MALTHEKVEVIWVESGKPNGGLFSNNPPQNQPKRIFDDETGRMISIPNEEGTERDLLRCKPGGQWEHATWVPISIDKR
ncbi:hypothetical protein D9M72_92560 [compost metagenome]